MNQALNNKHLLTTPLLRAIMLALTLILIYQVNVALQLHRKGEVNIQFKDLYIKELTKTIE